MDIADILVLLVVFIPLTLISLCQRKIKKYKPLKYDQYAMWAFGRLMMM